MPGLSASELAPETLRAGEVIEYYAHAFVFGSAMGHRRGIVTSVGDDDSIRFPIDVHTGDPISATTMIKRVADRFGNPLTALWRKLRTYRLVPGTFDAETRSSALNKALAGAVTAAVESVREVLRDTSEEIVPETPQSSACSSPEPEPSSNHVLRPSTPIHSLTAPASGEKASTRSHKSASGEGTYERSSIRQIIDLVSSGDESGVLSGAEAAPPRPASEVEAAAYLQAIPTRHERAKIRHQAKKKRAQWHVPRSRKRRYLAKCAITKSGSAIYHAKTFRAVKFMALQNSPEVKHELASLHARRDAFQDPAAKQGRTMIKTVAWPSDIVPITSCKRNGVKFPDSFDACECFGDCFWDTCSNVASASFCTPKYCKLGARCSNAPRTLDTLKLFDTGRVGLGVYTTTDLDVGDVLGEYCGELTEFPAMVEGQPPLAVKQNSGYTLLYNAKSSNGNYVYVDALRCGSVTRFISHSCQPNAAFVEQQTRSRVRVLVKMIKNVAAGAQITVHYGNERWFKCACDLCWQEPTQVEDSSDEA